MALGAQTSSMIDYTAAMKVRCGFLLASLLVIGCGKDAPSSDGSKKLSAETNQGGPVAIYDVPVKKLGGEESSLAPLKDKALLVVNVASQCGATPQYEGLEALQKKYGPRGFAVVGFPCNQFGGQEPGTEEEIKSFCTTNYGVTFPMFQKIEVNGAGRHPIYQELTKIADADGKAGDIGWNFEKFVVAPGGTAVKRFRTPVKPDDPALTAAIEAVLPK